MLRLWICRRCISSGFSISAEGGISRFRYVRLPQIRHQTSDASSAGLGEASYLSAPLLRRARQLSEEHESLEKSMEDDFDAKLAVKVGSLRPISEALKEYEKAVEDLKGLSVMLKDPDPDLSTLAQEDIPEAVVSLGKITQNLTATLVPLHPFALLPAILEIRPGTGGSEAALFANDLYKMYTAYCAINHWPTSILSYMSELSSGADGLTEVVFTVDIPGAYNKLRHEAGVHRVQRVPATETKGRTHTSTATVMVLPSFREDANVDDDELAILDPKDIRIDIMRARGAGGQHVNTTDSAVRMTHIPTGTVVAIQDSRSQHANREKAMLLLRAKVADQRRKEREDEMLVLRRGVVKVGAGRSDKVRTYNFSQNRVTDHRVGFSSHDLPGLMSGEGLGEMMERVATWDTGIQVENLITQQDEEEIKK